MEPLGPRFGRAGRRIAESSSVKSAQHEIVEGAPGLQQQVHAARLSPSITSLDTTRRPSRPGGEGHSAGTTSAHAGTRGLDTTLSHVDVNRRRFNGHVGAQGLVSHRRPSRSPAYGAVLTMALCRRRDGYSRTRRLPVLSRRRLEPPDIAVMQPHSMAPQPGSIWVGSG